LGPGSIAPINVTFISFINVVGEHE